MTIPTSQAASMALRMRGTRPHDHSLSAPYTNSTPKQYLQVWNSKCAISSHLDDAVWLCCLLSRTMISSGSWRLSPWRACQLMNFIRSVVGGNNGWTIEDCQSLDGCAKIWSDQCRAKITKSNPSASSIPFWSSRPVSITPSRNSISACRCLERRHRLIDREYDMWDSEKDPSL